MMESSSRQIIGLNGNSIETAGPFLIERLLPGEITIFNTPPSQPAVTASEQGVYTCRIQLQSGEIRDVNIGIYPTGFNSEFACMYISFTPVAHVPKSEGFPWIKQVTVLCSTIHQYCSYVRVHSSCPSPPPLKIN